MLISIQLPACVSNIIGPIIKVFKISFSRLLPASFPGKQEGATLVAAVPGAALALDEVWALQPQSCSTGGLRSPPAKENTGYLVVFVGG